MSRTYDAIVIGGGSAGLAFAKGAAGYGAKVLLIEKDKLGGTCVNRGCVPKKMIWAIADTFRAQAELVANGIFSQTPEFNMESFVSARDHRIADIVESYDDDLTNSGVDRLADSAKIVAPNTVEVGGVSYNTKRIVVATGTHPSPLDIPGADLAVTSNVVFEWAEVPKSLIVIGGGYIGCEMAAIFNALGSEVTLVSDGPEVLVEFSKASQKIAKQNLQACGVTIEFDTKPERFEQDCDQLTAHLDNGMKVSATHILNATGRDPNLSVFGDTPIPERAETGALKVSDSFETSTPGIYAVGDIADRLPLTPVAREDGKTLAAQMFSDDNPQPIDLNLVATTAFVFPPIGEVGNTDDLSDMTTFTAMESLIVSDAQDEGWAVRTTDEDRLAGVAVVGHAAAEAISWAAQVVNCKPSRSQMKAATAVHPSKAEEPLG